MFITVTVTKWKPEVPVKKTTVKGDSTVFPLYCIQLKLFNKSQRNIKASLCCRVLSTNCRMWQVVPASTNVPPRKKVNE
jgi:hypothetical protein